MISLAKNEEQLAQSVMNKISLAKDKQALESHVVSLSKSIVDLSKKADFDLGSANTKVVVALDYSGSMSTLYSNGTVQQTLNRLVPLGLTFDDNGSIDFYLFETGYRKMDDLNINNYSDYVKEVINKSGYRMGGTNYAPVLNSIINGEKAGIFKKAEGAIVDDNQPTFVLFITDGANGDERNTEKVLLDASRKNVFIQFIGIGSSRFTYLEKLDELPNRPIDNTGFSQLTNLGNTSDSELYNTVLGEFIGWLKTYGKYR